FVGCDTGDQVTLNWQIPPLGTPVVQIDADPLELGRSYPDTTGLLGDPKATAAALAAAIGSPVRDRSFADEAARIVADWRAGMAPLVEKNTAPIAVERLCAEITRALPDDAVLVADTGYSGIWTGTMIELTAPGRAICAPPARSAGPFPLRSAPNAPRGRARWCVSPATAASTTTSPSWNRRGATASPSPSSSTTIPASART